MTAQLDHFFAMLEQRGGGMYGDEPVTQLQHALQAATLAMESEAGDFMITAALFHDIGHLISDDDAQAVKGGVDLAHEEVAARTLDGIFNPEVIEPIRLHVPAKRYLCAVEPDYLSALSPASLDSLEVQGGPFTTAEADLFIKGRHGPAAVALRRWDDAAKDPHMTTLSLRSFRPAAERSLI